MLIFYSPRGGTTCTKKEVYLQFYALYSQLERYEILGYYLSSVVADVCTRQCATPNIFEAPPRIVLRGLKYSAA